ncbi:MAG: type II secretion system F family protein [Chloroflexi bacterium]|nr:MAG: type II secretion system F family protein [Chloroflexota bacterium]TMD80973.1 MAG: type II secretion system F family protein [Chloroflexota bacterium]TMF06101.1 MAG: type II secretion system F family protein [Chloroflexota bacterium]TMG31041.1 MAG: type II secretion system F family protein [Chloroflexota bacterium]
MLEDRITDAPSAAAVHRDLTRNGYRVVSVRPARRGWWHWIYRQMPTFFGVSTSDLVLFSRQLSTFLKVGVPITEAIRLLRAGTRSGPFKAALDDINSDLDDGESFSVAISHHPNVFSQLYVDMVRAAEYSGSLDRVLLQIAIYLQRQDTAIKKIRSAMIYPAIILTLAVGVCGVLIVVVLPNFVALFNEFHAQLPLPTQILIAVGSFAQTWRLEIVVGALVTTVAVFGFLQTGPGRVFWDHALIRLPVLGTIVVFAIVERFTRTLATMLRAGIPISQTFDVAAASAGNIRYRRQLDAVRQRMVTGDGFSEPLAATGLFAPMVIRMVRVGEETGTLDQSLEQIADFLAEEMDYKVRNMIALMEPALVIAVGAAVGFVAVSVVLPMYGLLRAVH